MSLVGYARLSMAGCRQLLDRQLDALQASGCERVFERLCFQRHIRSGEPHHLPRLPAPQRRPRRPRSRSARPPRRRARLPHRRAQRTRHRIPRAELAHGHYHPGGPGLSADPGRVRRDEAQRHPPVRARGHHRRCGARTERRASRHRDPGEASLPRYSHDRHPHARSRRFAADSATPRRARFTTTSPAAERSRVRGSGCLPHEVARGTEPRHGAMQGQRR